MEVSLRDDNLRPLLVGLGWLFEYNFDADDWGAVSHGMRDTEAEVGRWFEYAFSGPQPVPFSVAFDDNGSSTVWVRIALPPALEPQAQLLVRFCREFVWRGAYF